MPLFPLLGVVRQKKGVHPRRAAGLSPNIHKAHSSSMALRGAHCSKGDLPRESRRVKRTHLLSPGGIKFGYSSLVNSDGR